MPPRKQLPQPIDLIVELVEIRLKDREKKAAAQRLEDFVGVGSFVR
jgi:hypothetical protein